MENNNYTYYHNGIRYDFKWAKLDHVLEQMPDSLANKIETYFNFVKDEKKFPNDLFENSKVARCSNFRIKYLKPKGRDKITDYLLKNGIVYEFIPELESEKDSKIPKILEDLVINARELYFDFITQGYIKPNHDQILSKCLLSCNSALSVETPIWIRKKIQSTLRSFMEQEQKEFNFTHHTSVTGHIDLLVYDKKFNQLIVVDYKPEGQFLYSLPQVAIYALMLKKVLQFNSIKCISFRKENGWYYDPEILKNDIEKQMKVFGTNRIQTLKWRKIIKGL